MRGQVRCLCLDLIHLFLFLSLREICAHSIPRAHPELAEAVLRLWRAARIATLRQAQGERIVAKPLSQHRTQAELVEAGLR